jgi:hypothetical protein
MRNIKLDVKKASSNCLEYDKLSKKSSGQAEVPSLCSSLVRGMNGQKKWLRRARRSFR